MKTDIHEPQGTIRPWLVLIAVFGVVVWIIAKIGVAKVLLSLVLILAGGVLITSGILAFLQFLWAIFLLVILGCLLWALM